MNVRCTVGASAFGRRRIGTVCSALVRRANAASIAASWFSGCDLSTKASSLYSAARMAACTRCGRNTMTNRDGLVGSENVVAICLMFAFFIPGVLYYFDRTRLPYCSACKQRVPKPL